MDKFVWFVILQRSRNLFVLRPQLRLRHGTVFYGIVAERASDGLRYLILLTCLLPDQVQAIARLVLGSPGQGPVLPVTVSRWRHSLISQRNLKKYAVFLQAGGYVVDVAQMDQGRIMVSAPIG